MEETPEGMEMKWTGWGNALLVKENSMPKLVATLLTFIESLGFQEARERAIKEIIKRECWAILDDAWIIGDESHHELRKKMYEFGQLSIGGNQPLDPTLPPQRNSEY